MASAVQINVNVEQAKVIENALEGTKRYDVLSKVTRAIQRAEQREQTAVQKASEAQPTDKTQYAGPIY